MVALAAAAAHSAHGASKLPMQLEVDLNIDPAKEKALLETFDKTFRPTIRKQPGFVNVMLLKFVKAGAGVAPEGMNYRMIVGFETEELRMNWVKSADHARVWPQMEKHFRSPKFNALVFDVAV